MACPNDNEFGPIARCRDFDFTVTFEAAFFALTPSVLLLPFIVLRVRSVFRLLIVVDWLPPLVIKLITYSAVAALQLAELRIYAVQGGAAQLRLSLPAAALVFVATVGLAILSFFEHSRSLRPAPLVQAYLLLTLVLDAARLRTEWLIPGEAAAASLQSAGLVLKGFVLVVESLPKGSHLTVPKGASLSPEATAGFFSRSLLLWLVPLFAAGYRTVLSGDNIYPIDDELRTAKLLEAAHTAWLHAKPHRKRRLAIALAQAFRGQLIMVQLPRLALVGFAIAQPFLVQAALKYTANHHMLPVSFGFGLIGATAMVYIGVAVSTVWYQHLTYRLLTMIRGALIGMIFKHSLSLPASERIGSSEAVSIMGADIERIQQTLQWVMSIIPSIIQVVIALWILHTFLGVAFVGPLVVAIVCGTLASRVGKGIPPRQRRWMQAIQKRVGVTTDVLGSIKGVKMSGLSSHVTKQIQGLRAAELDDQRAFRHLQITNIALGNTPGMLTPAVTFAAFAIIQTVGGKDQFQVATAFTSLALLSILILPVAELVSATTNLASALSCLDRVQLFLEKQPLQDSRSLPLVKNCSVKDTADLATARTELLPAGGMSIQHQSGSGQNPLVRITNGTFGWESDKPILQGINLEVLPSKLIVVTGPVGVGKSTLLRSILGETLVLAGSVECASPKRIAYCDQELWILNVSLKENILGISEYVKARYDTVIEACQLQDDFEQLPKGEETLGGSKGLSLSGGQKQRISLARAAYSGKQLIVLDDTLSGLDASTSVKCFQALLGWSGLLRSNGISAVFATHDVQWLSFADEIIVIGGDGTIAARGNLEILSRTNDYVRGLQQTEETRRSVREEGELTVNVISGSAGSATPKQPLAEATRTEVEGAENKSRQPREINAFRYYVSSMGPRLIWGFAALVVCQVGFNTAQPLWLKFWTAANQRNPNEEVGKWVGIYVLFAVGSITFIALGTSYFFLLLVPRSSKNIHHRLLESTFGAPLSFFVAKDTGTLVNLFTGDLNLIDLPLPVAFLLATERAMSTIAEVVLTCVASGYLALSIPPLAALLYFLQRVYLRTSRQLRVLDLEFRAPLFSHFISTTAGIMTVRAFSWTAAVEAESVRLIDASQQPHYLLFCLQRWLTLVLDLVTAGMATLLTGLAVALRSSIDPGYLGVALVSVMNLGQISSALIMHWANFETALQAVGRVQKHMATTPAEWEGRTDGGSDENPDARAEQWPAHGEVVLSDVSVSYGELKSLDSVNLTFKAGSKVVICGRTGSGKSSLLGLLLRLHDPTGGLVSVDNEDLSTMSPERVRLSIAALPQDALFLPGSVRDNLDPYGDHRDDDTALLVVLNRTGLKGLIEEKGGLGTTLSVEWLSSGQRQLFCLARVMLRRSRILLLDEATSHVDAHTEKLVYELIKTDFSDWTVIAVTHRLKPVASIDSPFDHVVVLQQGRVIENDSLARLLNRKGGSVFREMVEMQES